MKVDSMTNKSKSNAVEKCYVCGSESIERTSISWKGGSFSRCVKCGLIVKDSQTSLQENKDYYEEEYYKTLSPQLEGIHKARGTIYSRILKQSTVLSNTRRLLDIGSGYGEFLETAEELGYEAYGLEPSKEACALAAKKFPAERIFQSTIDECNFPDNHFDVITFWNVLDCLPDPNGALQKVYKWLAPGGQLIIRTPNSAFHYKAHQIYHKFKKMWSLLGWKKDAAVFLQTNYNKQALSENLKRAGFDSVQVINGIPTKGDPYQIFRSSIVNVIKSIIFWIAKVVSGLTGGKCLVSSNMVAFASKESAEGRSQANKLMARIRFKSFVLHVFAILGYLLGLPIWIKLFSKSKSIPVLLYHSVDHLKSSDMGVLPDKFKKQLDFLKGKYHVIGLGEAVSQINRGTFDQANQAVITFDDGYEDNYRFAFPELKSRALPATIFLLADGHERKRATNHLNDAYNFPTNLLSWDQIREMGKSDISFGSHGQSHSRLSTQTDDTVQTELSHSKAEIEKEIQTPVTFFSYPYGTQHDFDDRVVQACKNSGYEAAVTAIYGRNKAGQDLYRIGRISVEASDSVFTLRAKLNGALNLFTVFQSEFVRSLIRWMDGLFLKIKPKSGVRKKDPMLLVSVDFPPHTDGVSTIARALSADLSRRENPFYIIGPKDQGDTEYDAGHPYKPYRTPGYNWGYLRMLPILLTMPYVVFRHGIRKVLALNIGYGGLIVWFLSFIRKIDYVLFGYGFEFEKVKGSKFMRAFYLKIYRRSEAVICCSEGVRQRLIEFGVDAGKVKTLYPAVDLEKYQKVEVPADYLREKGLAGKRILLTVGRLVERKGHDRVLEAVASLKVKYPDLLYCIVGMGPHEEALRTRVREMQLENHVAFMGRLPEQELIYLYSQCEVFIMASREIEACGQIEGFGIVFLEANAFSKPVIGGKSGGVLEAIRDGETGYFVDPFSSDDIAQKIDSLFADPELAKKLGEEGFRWVHTDFNWKSYSQSTYEYLVGKEEQ